MVRIITRNKYPNRGNVRAISESSKVNKPEIKLDRRNHLGKPLFNNPSIIYIPPIMKILIIKTLNTTILLYMGFAMENITNTEVNRNITNEYKTFVNFSDKLINLAARLKIILISDELIKVIKIKITSTMIESNGIKTANITKNKLMVPKIINLGLIFISSLPFLIASQVLFLLISR